MTLKYYGLETCVFGHRKRFAGLELQQVLMHTKLPIISFPQKLVIFLLLDFRRIQEQVFDVGIVLERVIF